MQTPDIFDNGKKLPVVEEFYSLQGEGFHTGKAAYFLRIGGCDVGCHWCDSKESWDPARHPLVGVEEIIARIVSFPARSVVVTGGEPLMYRLEYLTSELKKQGVKTFLETSGTHPLTGDWDWICLSPKPQFPPLGPIFLRANELKVIVENAEDFAWAERCAKRVNPDCLLYLQPEWSVYKSAIAEITHYIMQNPHWQVSLQSHKFMKIP
jgi:organic radical activating enzyme